MRVPKPNWIDRVVGFVNPRAAVDRMRYRAALSAWQQYADGTGYQVGGSTSRVMRGWNPSAKSADADVTPVLERSRASSRDLYMNTPIATAALRRVRTNVVGSGLTLQSRVDREALGISEGQADDWIATTEREWRLWSESRECDATRTQDFYGLQALAFLSTLMNGDAFAAIPQIKRIPQILPYRTTVQLIEADQVSNPWDKPESSEIAGGVEVDAYGAPVAYHVRKVPSTLFAATTSWVRVPAYGERSGRRNVLHLYDKERIGQRRGMPMLANVFSQLKQVSRLSDAELMAAVIASFFTVFVKSTSGPGALNWGFSEDESLLSPSSDGSYGKTATAPDNNLYEIGSGNVIELGEDQEVQIADPKRPSDAFDPFFTSIVRQIGAAMEVPYEQLMLSFTSSYSASRAALLEAWKFYRSRRSWLACNFCQPVYEEWLAEAIALGRVKAPGFFRDPAVRHAWSRAWWGGPGQGQIDPVKETKGATARIKAALSTYEDEYVAINGGDWESAMRRRQREDRILEDTGQAPTLDVGNGTPGNGGG